ncbi:MAG: 4Fe-4S ferredoxin [Dissulfurispiraceae bacterium]
MAFEGCPGSKMVYFQEKEAQDDAPAVQVKSQLRQWPVQLHLVSPLAPYFQGADVLLSADCVAYALGNFHSDYLKGKSLAIACPKLDAEQDIYVEKIKSLIEDAKINKAAQKANRKVPIKYLVVGMQGEILQEAWV